MVSVLFVSGALWLLTDRLKHTAAGEMWSRMSASLLMLHGAAAMLMLVLFGSLMPFHVRVGWRRKRNRITGTVMVATNAALIVTAFGLYYAGRRARGTGPVTCTSWLGSPCPRCWRCTS